MNTPYKDNSIVAESANISDSAQILHSEVGAFCQLFDDSMLCYSKLGEMSYLSRRTSVFSSVIGKYCSISWNVSIGPAMHDYKRMTQHAMLYANRFGMIDSSNQRYYNQYDKDTIIGNDVWIGCNAVIMRGVHIGDGAVIGANSVISKDVEPYSIMVGVNRIIKYRFSNDIIDRLLHLKWWDFPIHKVKMCLPYLAVEPTNETIYQIERILKE